MPGFGFAEKTDRDIFNRVIFMDGNGWISSKYQKTGLHDGPDAGWRLNRRGVASRALDTSYGRCGLPICTHRWNHRLANISCPGSDPSLVIPSFVSTSRTHDGLVLPRGVENSLPVIEVNLGVSMLVSENKIRLWESTAGRGPAQANLHSHTSIRRCFGSGSRTQRIS